MKVEYLANEWNDRPLIRLYEFNQTEVRQLTQLVRSLVAGDRERGSTR
jgi:hypothetical protein